MVRTRRRTWRARHWLIDDFHSPGSSFAALLPPSCATTVVIVHHKRHGTSLSRRPTGWADRSTRRACHARCCSLSSPSSPSSPSSLFLLSLSLSRPLSPVPPLRFQSGIPSSGAIFRPLQGCCPVLVPATPDRSSAPNPHSRETSGWCSGITPTSPAYGTSRSSYHGSVVKAVKSLAHICPSPSRHCPRRSRCQSHGLPPCPFLGLHIAHVPRLLV